MISQTITQLPIPSHFDAQKVGQVWRVPYQQRAVDAKDWEALFFHSIARSSQTRFEIKGDNPLTENYSVLSAEVLQDVNGQPIAQKNTNFIQYLLEFDAVIIAGQAKSHCVAWTIEDLLTEITAKNSNLAHKIYLLEDCTSPVVVPGVVDYTEQANDAFARFAEAGMNLVNSTAPIESWLNLSSPSS